ncbi:MAG: AAA domain-containing protein [Imperialibacter sp.]|uniref:AAA domain-containing protein n=1 Tax=Imperialibacter sp. TaxID=2038411 RepID=UPI0032EE74B4
MTDTKSYFTNLTTLLKKEWQEDLQQYKDKILYTAIPEKKKSGVCWYPVVVNSHHIGTGEKIVLELEKTTDLEQAHMFQGGGTVSFYANTGEKDKGSSAITGVIKYVRKSKMGIVLNDDDLPDWINDGKLGIDLMFDEASYREMERTLKVLGKQEAGRLFELTEILLGKKAPQREPAFAPVLPSLNAVQNKALEVIIEARDLAIVHGPPGTGKTTTLIQSVKEVVKLEKQVLVTAPSNAAVDVMVEKLAEEGINVLRLGHPARVTNRVIENSLDARIAAHDSFKELRTVRKKYEEYRNVAFKYKRNFGHAERQQRKLLLQEAGRFRDEADMLENYITSSLLDNAQVIACTLVGSNHYLLKDRVFKTVFIDEAGQALEPACWIPILKANRVIMTGDHQQLPPTVKSFEAAKEGLENTLFQKNVGYHSTDVMLEEQYRMKPEIMAFSSKFFYNDKLQAAPSAIEREALPNVAIMKFIDTAGCGYQEKVNPESRSTYNEEEGRLLIDQLLANIETIGEEHALSSQITFGVIAPYKAQIELLREVLLEKGLSQELMDLIDVNTVDSFQGQERDSIFIGFTRSNEDGEIGFLKDIRRTNVAMTRARRQLIMIGDSATLGSNNFYNQLVEHCTATDAYQSAFELIYS